MSTYGRFVGTVKAEWSESNRRMKLLEDFVYILRRWSSSLKRKIQASNVLRNSRDHKREAFVGGPHVIGSR
jgi:hypothetical protein